MLYSDYSLYDGGMRVMVPSYLEKTDSILSSQYMWSSNDRKTLVNITLGSADLSEDSLRNRLSEYYSGYTKEVNGFKCDLIRKRKIYDRPYGEIRYHSKMMGYDFFNMFLLGIYGGRELIFTIQCVENEDGFDMHVFENIADSLKVVQGG